VGRIFQLYVIFLASASWGQNFVLTETQLANGLLVNKKELSYQAKLLGRYLGGDSSVLRSCKNNYSERPALCKLVIALDAYKDDDKKASIEPQHYSPTPERLLPRTFTRAQRAKPGELLDVMKNYSASQVMEWLPKLINDDKCPQNLLIASLRMYEVALPSDKAQASLEVGYKRALRCLSEKDPYHEITHQRQGLLRYMWGDLPGAQRALKLALRSDNPKEKEITLFWLGYIEKNPKIKRLYWDKLIEDYPLSFHALSANKLLGKDPYEEYLKKPLLKPQRRVKDVTAQVALFWVEALYMYNDTKNAINLSYKISKRFESRYNAANLAYIAALADKYSLPGDAMQLSSYLTKKNSGLINAQTLKFLYPKPFQQTFDRIAQKVDPLLTLSVAKQESGFNPNARSPANARGLLQILPSTAEIYAPKSKRYLYDIDTNIEVGGKILADLIGRLGKTEYALAAYNAGTNRVEDWRKRYDTDDGMLFIDLIPYTETRGYVANVLRNHYWYTSLYGKAKGIYR